MAISSNEEDALWRAREAMLRLGKEIAERRVEGRSNDGRVTATALVTGQIIGIEIDPRVFRNPDSVGLATSVLEAINNAVSAAGKEHLTGLSEALGMPVESYNDIFSNAQRLAEELFEEAEEMRRYRR